MDGGGPSLVPQWLRTGSSIGGSSLSSNSHTFSGEITEEQAKFRARDWEDKGARHIANPHTGSGEPTRDDKAWKRDSSTAASSRSSSRSLYQYNQEVPESRVTLASEHLLNGPSGHGVQRTRHRNVPETPGFGGFARVDIQPHEEVSRDLITKGGRELRDPKTNSQKGPFEREFPTLSTARPGGGYVPSVAPYKQDYLASRSNPTWTSKLADAPAQANGVGQSHASSSSLSPTSSQPIVCARSDGYAQPSAAAVLQNGQNLSQALQQNIAFVQASTEKQKLEQLTLRQSKQLIPVISQNRSRQAPRAVPLQRNDASKQPTRSAAVRKVDEAGLVANASQKRPNDRLQPQKQVQPTCSSLSNAVGSGMVQLRPNLSTSEDRGKEPRSLFFESLRKKVTAEVPSSGNGSLETAGGYLHCSSPGQAAEMQDDTAFVKDGYALPLNNGPTEVTEYKSESGESALLRISAEEEAFLKSLGWTEADDENEGGLTEEEIAAFKAAQQHVRASTKVAILNSAESGSLVLKPPANGISCSSDTSTSESDVE